MTQSLSRRTMLKATGASVSLPFLRPLISAAAPRNGEIHVVVPETSNPADWVQFRGPAFNHTDDKNLPTKWSLTENMAWKTALPGMGNSSPIVVGDKIFVTCYSGFAQSKEDMGDWRNLNRHLLCIDRATGDILWNKSIRTEHEPQKFEGWIHLNGYASHTPTSDGERVYAHFGNSGVVAYDLDGKQVWHTPVGENISAFGSAASPVIYGDLLIVNASIESERMLALNRSDGRIRWETPAKHSYASPLVACVRDHHEVIVPVERESIIGIHADTGERLWNWAGQQSNRYICASPILANGIVYGTGSVDGPLGAIRPGGNGDITDSHQVWRDTNYKAECSSPVYHDGKVFWLGRFRHKVFDSRTGEVLYQGRAEFAQKGGEMFATPLVAGDRMYLRCRSKGVWIVALDNQLTTIAHNRELEPWDGFGINASPVPHNGSLLLRTNKMLYCVGAG